MKNLLLMITLAISAISCERSQQGIVTSNDNSQELDLPILSIDEKRITSIHEKNGTVILNQVIPPNQKIEIPDVTGANSMGFLIDDEFQLSEAGGFVRIYGSDGSELGAATGGEFINQQGSIQATYTAVNKGTQSRRLLVYRTDTK